MERQFYADYKYGCTLWDNKVSVICAGESKVNESGYNEENHQVGKCPRGACNNNNLVYIEGEGMFCAVCREFDAKQKKNGSKIWNSIPNVRCRTTTIEKHLKSEMHEEAMFAHNRR